MSSNDLFRILNYWNTFTRYIWEKINEYFLYGTIMITILTVIFIVSIVIESKLNIFSSNFLNSLLNTSNHVKKHFLNQIIFSLNENFLLKKERLKIETLQFSHANIHHISQIQHETIIIRAILDIDHLIFNVVQKDYFSIKISKFTGNLEIQLINNIIEVKFRQLHMNIVEIIDIKNILSTNEKESIIKLFEDVIYQTVVQCNFYLTTNQEKTSTPIKLEQESVRIEPPVETPMIIPIKTKPREIKKLLIRIVKAVQLHDVEQPYCVLELNQPKQTHQTSLAKNGLNPFWDERFLFECNEKSNLIRLKIIDRKKPTKKHPTSTDNIYADVTIPFAYVTSTIYKQDVRITPQYPESIIRIEFSTLTDEEAAIANHDSNSESINNSPNWSITGQELSKIERDSRQTPSDEILTLAYNENSSPPDYQFTHNNRNYASIRSQPTTFSTSLDTDNRRTKPRKSRSFMNSFRIFVRRRKGKENENGFISPTNHIPHSVSAEPFLSSNQTNRRNQPISRSFRNLFRSNSKKQQPINTTNFILDHPDLLSNSTPIGKKRSFFRRFRSKRKQSYQFSANSLTSDDCTRTESVRNTPIRANVGRPVTMTNSNI